MVCLCAFELGKYCGKSHQIPACSCSRLKGLWPTDRRSCLSICRSTCYHCSGNVSPCAGKNVPAAATAPTVQPEAGLLIPVFSFLMWCFVCSCGCGLLAWMRWYCFFIVCCLYEGKGPEGKGSGQGAATVADVAGLLRVSISWCLAWQVSMVLMVFVSSLMLCSAS